MIPPPPFVMENVMFSFAHIAPTAHLDLTAGRDFYLVLAHLVEEDEAYCSFYLNERARNPGVQIILDNSAFELYKRGLPMYPSNKLIKMAQKIKADYIVMTDYPAEDGEKTIEAAKALAPEIHAAGFKTFFVPQSSVGDIKGLMKSFGWAASNIHLIDYVGVSILSAPNAYGVERGNKMQRFTSRLRLMYDLRDTNVFYDLKAQGCKVHFLGMVDGPNEVMFMSPFAKWIDSWDSSSAVWLGLNDRLYDRTPTGIFDGKFELEVDFQFKTSDYTLIDKAKQNMNYIDRLGYGYLWDN